MFAKLCILAAVLPLALGLTIETPSNVTAGLPSLLKWATTAEDEPTFSMELNHPSFRASLAILNNINPTEVTEQTVQFPIVPADNQYTLSAVNIGNISQVYAITGQFAIAQAPTTGVSASVSTTFSSGASSGASATPTGSSGTSSGASTTGGSSGSSGSSTGSAPASSGSSGSFNGSGSNGAASLNTGNAGFLAVVLAAVAGAAAML